MKEDANTEVSCWSVRVFVWVVWSCIKLYVIGVYALLIQLFGKPNKPNLNDLNGEDMVAIVTGGASGIGFQVVRKLALRNVYVIIASRDEEEAVMAIQRIRAERSTTKVGFLQLDLSSISSVEAFAKLFIGLNLPLHILVNNAGVMLVPYRETDDHMETHFQVNYLSHLYLTCLLINKIKDSGTQARCSRVINVSSVVHVVADVEDIQPRWESYSPHAAYAASKLAVILGTYTLGKRLRGDNSHVTVNVMHPGVVNSNLYNNIQSSVKWIMDILRFSFFMTTSDAGDKIVYLALSPEVEGHTMGYYDNYKFIQSKDCTYSSEEQLKLARIANQELGTSLREAYAIDSFQ